MFEKSCVTAQTVAFFIFEIFEKILFFAVGKSLTGQSEGHTFLPNKTNVFAKKQQVPWTLFQKANAVIFHKRKTEKFLTE